MKRPMKFYAPEGDAAGGAAVADLPPLENIGEKYKESLKKITGEIQDAPDLGKPKSESDGFGATGPAATGAASTGVSGPAASGATGPAKPASALDAALEGAATGASGATGATGPATEDYLKDIPEVLPKEGRKENWEKARGAISKLGTTVGERDKRISELTAELETAKASPSGTTEEIASLRKQLDEYKDAVVAINVEYDPEHRKKFVDGRVDLVGKAASKAHAFGGDQEGIKKAMDMPEGRGRSAAIKEALSGIEDEYDRGRVLDLIKDVAKLDDEKADLMKDPQGAWARLQESEKARITQAAQKAEEYKKTVFETVAKTMPDKASVLREVDPDLPGATEHNASAKAMKESAFKLLGNDAKPEHLVEAAFWREAGPKTQELLVTTRKELTTALAALKGYEKADPGFRGAQGPKKTPDEAKMEKSPGDIYKETMAGFAGGND